MATKTVRPPDARVFRNDYGLFVVPKDVFKHVGAKFSLLNNTSLTVHVTFPGLVMDPAECDIPSRSRKEFKILKAEPGIYDYHVQIALLDERSKSFTLRASGGSDPRIIIDF